MSAVTTPLQELADAGQAARKFRLTCEFDLVADARLLVHLTSYRFNNTPTWWLTTTEQGPRRNHGQAAGISDVTAALRQVATAYPQATLRPESIKVAIEKGPTTGSVLRPIAIQAWHEVYGLPIPTTEELAEQQKAHKAARQAADGGLVGLLKSGPAGVAEFNARPDHERARADLRKADLAGDQLDGIEFSGANLEGADLSGASLVKAIFGGMSASPRLKGAKFVGADLTAAKLGMGRGADADFRRANLRGAWLGFGNYPRARFDGADLTDAVLTGADLRGADFTDARLDGLSIERAKFDEHTRWPKGFRAPADLVWKGNGPDPRQAPTKKEKTRPAPTDFAGFVDRLKAASDPGKLDKAMAMLKADRFRLFARVAGDHLVGVVKSQSDPTLVYSCRLADDGAYSCCTQNLNVCGGLRGSPCKHLLVLIVGLAQAGELDPATAHAWTQASRGQKPALDKDAMAEVLLQYKGAEAGEVDWRPTETIPEDFYAM